MKRNLPVTDHEVLMEKGKPIISKTNLKGQIIAVNRTFIEISGFSLDELINKQHNLVRHPDMPPPVFQEMWDTIKADRPWKGFIKNRVKNGDYYWVYAQVTPVKENGETTQYMSVRRMPSREQIKAAEADYAHINEGKTIKRPLFERLGQWFTNLKALPSMAILLFLVLLIHLVISQYLSQTIASAVSAFLALSFIYTWLSSNILKPLGDIKKVIENITEGTFNNEIQIWRTDEVGLLQQRLQSLQLKFEYQMEELKFKAEDATRIQSALTVCDTSVMMLDTNQQVIYLNDAFTEMLIQAQDDFAEAIDDFAVDKVIGQKIDYLLNEQTELLATLANLSSGYATEIHLADHIYNLSATPVFSEDKDRIGTVIEWKDLTAERAIEAELDDMISAATKGNLSKRLSLDNKHGFYLKLAEGLNQLADVSEDIVGKTGKVLEALSEGNLDVTIADNYQGAFAQLRESANTTVAKLKEIIAEVRSSTASVSSGAREISDGNLDLSQRTEEQASALQETAASMEELTATVRENAESASRASTTADEAAARAEAGGEVVGQAVAAMDQIKQSSSKIADIISVIDEIAFQTNLLALNAAVEAARAGEQGRGFAVVASEVRNLAQRSADAAEEITDLINDSVTRVNEGSKLVYDSGETLNEIVAAVNEVSHINRDISTSTLEQSEGIEQVNVVLSQLDETTQQNAALVEQASAATMHMAQLANVMDQMMDFFHSEDDPVKAERQVSPIIHTPIEATVDNPELLSPESKKQVVDDDDDIGWEEF